MINVFLIALRANVAHQRGEFALHLGQNANRWLFCELNLDARLQVREQRAFSRKNRKDKLSISILRASGPWSSHSGRPV